MPKYENVLFDLDGTIIDSKEGVIKSIQYALSKYGIKVEDGKSLLPLIGAVLVEEFQHRYSLKTDEAMEAVGFYREYYSETGMFDCKIYNGITELLRELKTLDCRLVLATLKPSVYINKILKCFNVSDFFTNVIGPDLNEQAISKPQIIGRALDQIPDLDKSKTVMVGDRASDLTGAHENGIDSVAVTYGYGSLSELARCNPSYFADSVNDLKQLLILAYRQF